MRCSTSFRAKPSDPPNLGRASWPVTRQGAHIARVFGWMTDALVVIFWGFSNDGLGRNCLEPLTIMVIALTAADHKKLLPIWPLGIALL